MEIKFNGIIILSSRDWSTPSVATVTVQPGMNEIAVRAKNWLSDGIPYGAGGFVAAIWRSSESSPLIVTDGSWRFRL